MKTPLLFLFTLLFNILYAQIGDIEWSFTYGGSQVEEPERIIQTQDGNYVTVGFSASSNGDIGENSGDWDILVMKLDQTGNIIWKKIYGEEGGDIGRSIIQTSDGGYILIGDSVKTDGSNVWKNIRVIKLNENGESEWDREYETTNNGTKLDRYGYDIKETVDGGFVFVGMGGIKIIEGDFDSLANYYVVKLDTEGNTEWEKSYGGNAFTAHPRSIDITHDGGFVVAGDIRGNSHLQFNEDITHYYGEYDIWVIRLDSDGELIWQKTLGGDEWEKAGNVVVTHDGNFVVGGFTGSTNGDVSSNVGANDFWVVKLNDEGEILWEKTYGSTDNDEAYDMKQAPNGDLYLIGFARAANGDVSENFGAHDYWLIHTDSNGNLLNEKSFGGNSEDRGKSLYINQDGSVILAGMSNSIVGDNNHNYGYDYWIIKLGATMSIESLEENEYSIYPVLTKDFININSQTLIKSIRVFSLNGQLLMEKSNVSNHLAKIDLNQMKPGVYILHTILQNGKVHIDKIIKK